MGPLRRGSVELEDVLVGGARGASGRLDVAQGERVPVVFDGRGEGRGGRTSGRLEVAGCERLRHVVLHLQRGREGASRLLSTCLCACWLYVCMYVLSI